MNRTHITLLTRLMALTMLMPPIGLPLAAEAADRQIEAAAYSHDAFQLTPATPTVTRSIVVDATPAFSVSVLAASRTLAVSLVAPNGTRYSVNDPATATFESGFFPIDTVSTQPGASYLISITNPLPGTWTLEVSESATLSAPLEVITTTFLNNSTWLLLAGGGDSFPLGTDVRLALVAFSGTNKVHGLSIEARLFRPFDPTFTPVDITFRDDGTGADETAGDGIYEAFINPAQPGTYQVQVSATGVASTGSFRRTAATELRIVPHNAQITGFTDRGLDDDLDGLYDRIGITPSADLIEAGTYVISVRLRASNSNEVQRSVSQDFSVGTASAEVTFTAEEIVRDLGVNGPYSVAEVRYFEVVSGDLVPADIRYDLGSTAPYTLDQLQHPPLRLSGTDSATGVDTNANSLYDLFNINVGVIADFAGSYNYSASLIDCNGRELGFDTGSASLSSGTNALSLTFPGLPIGQGGVDGPYFLSNLLLFGTGHSLIATKVFTTPPFLASQFEGFVPKNQPPVAKCKNVTASAGPGCVASASIDDGSFDPDAGDVITLSQSPASPYSLGDTSVMLTVTDNHGASSNCTATVTVVDDTPPQIACPANIVTNATSTAGAVVKFELTASDNCSLASVSSTPPSGSTFAIGTTTVACAATDAAGNTNSCTFTVEVKLADSDQDGVPDYKDRCPNTPARAIVNACGCSIDQLVPCAGPASGGMWKSHGQYLRAVVVTATDFLNAKLITRKQWVEIVTRAAWSKCGWNRRCDHDWDWDWHRNWDCDRDRDWGRNRDWDR
jgi:hypothetical protein